MFDWIIHNKEILKIIYGIVISTICLLIVFRIDRLFRLSLHEGIRYFRNAFLFFGAAFFVRYIIGAFLIYGDLDVYLFSMIRIVFEFFLIMAGFFLLYSLLWKRIEASNPPHYSSLLNSKIGILYLMTIILVMFDLILDTYAFMFFSQVALFFIASIVSFSNYRRGSSRHKFLKFYFVAMFLSLVAWLFNTIAGVWFNWDQTIIITSYILNIIIFLLFLSGVIKVTKR